MKVQRMVSYFGLAIAVGSGISSAYSAEPGTLKVYRCLDAKGAVSLQDSPCAKSSKQETREVLLPKDKVPVRKSTAVKAVPVIQQTAPAAVNNSWISPPVLYQCTDYQGKTRDAENYDTNPRCEPLWALGYRENTLPIEHRGNTCSWVRDSCLPYEGQMLCERWKLKQKQAQSDVRYAFSDTVAYKRSELVRITQIVQRSCQ